MHLEWRSRDLMKKLTARAQKICDSCGRCGNFYIKNENDLFEVFGCAALDEMSLHCAFSFMYDFALKYRAQCIQRHSYSKKDNSYESFFKYNKKFICPTCGFYDWDPSEIDVLRMKVRLIAEIRWYHAYLPVENHLSDCFVHTGKVKSCEPIYLRYENAKIAHVEIDERLFETLDHYMAMFARFSELNTHEQASLISERNSWLALVERVVRKLAYKKHSCKVKVMDHDHKCS